MAKYKTLTKKQHAAVECEVKRILHAHRDCMRNKFSYDPSRYDPKRVSWDCQDGYFGEAFGIMRGLAALGYGFFGADLGFRGADNGTEPYNLKVWFSDLQRRVLDEEGFRGNNECDFCLDYYGKDGAGRKVNQDVRAKYREKYYSERRRGGLAQSRVITSNPSRY